MAEDIIFRRRNRLKKHFTNTSNVLLYCYETLTDAAKITFQVIDSFDWEDKEAHDSKGYVFPAVEKIATLRRTSDRTIRRHIHELIEAKLLTRIRRRNKPSILYIEDVSDNEVNKYFDLLKPQTPTTPVQKKGRSDDLRTDKNDHSHKAQERTKMTVAYMNKNEMKENKNNVNEDRPKTAERKSTGMTSLGDISFHFDRDTYRLVKKPDKPLTEDARAKRDYYAQTIAEELNDAKSLGAFRVIAEHVPESVIFQALGSVKEASRDGTIKKSKGALFMTIINQWCSAHGKTLGFQKRVASISLAR